MVQINISKDIDSFIGIRNIFFTLLCRFLYTAFQRSHRANGLDPPFVNMLRDFFFKDNYFYKPCVCDFFVLKSAGVFCNGMTKECRHSFVHCGWNGIFPVNRSKRCL